MKLFAPHCSEINLNKISLEWFSFLVFVGFSIKKILIPIRHININPKLILMPHHSKLVGNILFSSISSHS